MKTYFAILAIFLAIMKTYIHRITKQKGFEMNKLPAKFRQPIVGLGIMIVMLSSLPAILVSQNLPPQADFGSAYFSAIGQMAPYAVPLAIGSAIFFNLAANIFVEKVR